MHIVALALIDGEDEEDDALGDRCWFFHLRVAVQGGGDQVEDPLLAFRVVCVEQAGKQAVFVVGVQQGQHLFGGDVLLQNIRDDLRRRREQTDPRKKENKERFAANAIAFHSEVMPRSLICHSSVV
ncbi:MAG TPA: hypothetical protein VGL77_11260 [Armatimonadota bacterium]